MRAPTGYAMLVCAVLGACTSTQEVLDPTAIAATEGTSQETGAEGQAAAAASGNGSVPSSPPQGPRPAAEDQIAAVRAKARLQFAPIVGPSVEAATALSERLAGRARERGMRLAGSADASATHMLKGYFSTLDEGGRTTVIYVWDVYDPAGTRLHRLNGQQEAPKSKAQGWAAVTPSTMEGIANSTIDQFDAWLTQSPG